MSERDETLARAIFMQAIREERCAELLHCLFDGGSATVDAVTGKLVVVSSDQLAAMVPAEAEEGQRQ
jgi:hypothetical protein